MLFNVKKTFLLLLFVSLLSSCADMTNEDTGVVTGAALGGLVGSRFGGGAGRMIATGAGALAGAYFGGQIGQLMDKDDQARLNKTLETTKTGHYNAWENPDKGKEFRVEPTETYYYRGRPCRKFRTTVLMGDKKQVVRGRACRDKRGHWHMQ